jgi:hypothetical protein
MAQQDPVTVEHGGVTITTNTASEADLRAEMTRDAPAQDAAGDRSTPQETATPPPPGPADAPAAPGPARDEHGRFTRTEAATPPAELPEAAPEAPETPQRRRDDTTPRHNPIARMNQALAKAAEADRRAQAAEAALALLQGRAAGLPGPPSAPPGPPAPGPPASDEPQFEQFANEPDPYTAFLDAKWEWRLNQRLARERAAWQAEQTQKARLATFEQRIAEGRKAHADFDQALTEADTLGLQISAVMQEAIIDSPRPADLVHYLATHPEECAQLAADSQAEPAAAAKWVRRLLESRSSAARVAPANGSGTTAPAATSTAKPPITPVGSSPVVTDQPPGDGATLADHARYWNRRLKVPGALK